MENENQINVEEHEQQSLEEINEQKLNSISFNIGKKTFKQKLIQFIANIIHKLIFNFTTKKKWQFGLVIYLIIVCPIGSFVSIKFIFNSIESVIEIISTAIKLIF